MTATAHLTVTRDMVFPISAPPVRCDQAARVPQASVAAGGTLSIGSSAGRPIPERLAGRHRRISPTPSIRHIASIQESAVPDAPRRLIVDERARSVVGETSAARDSAEFIDRIRQAAAKRLLFLPHAVRQMTRPDRMIEPIEVREAVMEGELIEDYPEDVRGHSGLIHGKGKHRRDIHVVCAPKEDFLAIITAYIPCRDEWEQDLRTRRRQ